MASNSQTRLPSSDQTLYLIDISSFIFRAFFAIRSLHNKAGEPTNAVYGVATMLAKLVEEAKPKYLAVVYDSREPSFRKEIYPEYKANRSAPPDDLVPQFGRIEQLIQLFQIHSYRQSGVEADDLIATLARRWEEVSSDHKVVIVSSDKDLMQLVTDRVMIWDTMTNKYYGPMEVEEKFGVKPNQIRDYLGLVGDSSDNIPGVPSIGPKTATDLLKEYKNLDGILAAAAQGKITGKKGQVFQTHEKEARLSAELATVKEDLPVKIPLEELSYEFQVTEPCIQFLREMDFHSLVNKWQNKQIQVTVTSTESQMDLLSAGTSRAEASQLPNLSDSRFRPIQTREAFQEMLKELRNQKEFGIDLETTSLNPHEAQIVGIALCYNSEFAVYIPVGHRETTEPQLDKNFVLSELKPILESPNYLKVGQNLKYDWSVLRANGIHPKGLGADTMVAAYILDPGNRYNLETLATQYLNYSVLTYEQICGKGKDQISFEQVTIPVAVRYSAEDAWIAMKLWEKFRILLNAEGLTEIFEKVDLPLVEVLTEMELEGVWIDVAWLNQLSREFGQELQQIEERVQVYAKGPINLNSPKQLATLLFEELKLPTQGKTKTGFSTDAQVLEALAPLHEVPRLLLEYREISKLKGTYVDPLPMLRDAKTGKIHASFNQTIAATGRLSSSDPNLQNIPIRTERGLRIRRAFIPSPGNQLLSADYSQIELRLLAHMSQDPELIRAFQKNEDVHRRTASEIFSVPLETVDDRQRGIAKAINFGLMYGKTAFGLAQELKIPRREAQEIIEKYFTRYHRVKEFLDKQVQDAREKGYVSSLMGRKRKLPDIRSKNVAMRNNAERMAMNSPIQATAADLMKLAMIEIERRLEKEGYHSKLIIQVHDEVVLDCPKAEIEKISKLVVQVMENAMSLSIPLRVNTSIGENWMSL